MALLPTPTSLNELNDDQLLRRYVTNHDGTAITELISRYAPIVYAAARRQVGDSALAEDICQTVLVNLARRANSIRSGAVLGAWLLQTTRFSVANAMKIQTRRRRHEKAAAQIRPELLQGSDPARIIESQDEQQRWAAICPVLDRAIARLAWADQTAIALRILRGLSLREVATATGTTEEAARKRVTRATDRLRKALADLGVSPGALAAADLEFLLTHRAVQSPPAHLAARLSAASAHIAPGSIHLGVWLMTGIKLTAAASVAALLVVAAVDLPGRSQTQPAPQAAASSGPAQTQPAAPAADWHDRFNEVYGLADGQYIKNVSEPFIPERQKFFQEINPRAAATNNANQFIIEQSAAGIYRLRLFGQFGGEGGPSVNALLPNFARLQPGQIDDESHFFDTNFTGDWIMRPRATPDQIVRGLAQIVADKLGVSIDVAKSTVDRDVVVATGAVRADKDGSPPAIHIVLPGGDASAPQFGGGGPISAMFRRLSQQTGYTFIDQSTRAAPGTFYRFDLSGGDPDAKLPADALKDLLKSLTDQTGLTFRQETRPFTVWKLSQSPAK
jgi:RNA polymerase sigma factor (sigma-70 family)